MKIQLHLLLGHLFCLSIEEIKTQKDCQFFEQQIVLGSIVGTQESVATNQECSAFCSSVPDCQGWTRNQEDGVCILLSEIAREINNPEWDWGPRCCQSFDKQIALGSPATEPKTMLTNQKCSVWCSSHGQ